MITILQNRVLFSAAQVQHIKTLATAFFYFSRVIVKII